MFFKNDKVLPLQKLFIRCVRHSTSESDSKNIKCFPFIKRRERKDFFLLPLKCVCIHNKRVLASPHLKTTVNR